MDDVIFILIFVIEIVEGFSFGDIDGDVIVL